MPETCCHPFDSVEIGPQTMNCGVIASRFPAHAWLQNYQRSALLEHYQIAHLGVVTADPNYRATQVQSPYSHFLACLEGEAGLWSDEGFQKLQPGVCGLLPKGASYIEQTLGGRPWKFAYVCYSYLSKSSGFHGVYAPQIEAYDPSPIKAMIETFYSECLVNDDLECQRQMLGLIHHMVMRFIQKKASNERLRDLWQRVSSALAEDWSLERMERETHFHREQLRRLCQRYYGRSPGRQVAFIRMSQAAALLKRTTWTIEHIATAVGYGDPFSFSTAFKHWYQMSPAHYRLHIAASTTCAVQN